MSRLRRLVRFRVADGATAAHELNQPLTTILGFADMAMQQLEETHRRGALDRITEAAERLAGRRTGRLKRIVTRRTATAPRSSILRLLPVPSCPRSAR